MRLLTIAAICHVRSDDDEEEKIEHTERYHNNNH